MFVPGEPERIGKNAGLSLEASHVDQGLKALLVLMCNGQCKVAH